MNLKKVFDTPLKQRTRRLIVIGIYLLIALGTYLMWQKLGIAVLPLFLAFALVVKLNRSTGFVALSNRVKFDERQRALQDKSQALSYQILLILAMLIMISFFAVDSVPSWVLRTGSIVFYMMFSIIPPTVLSWLEPDPITEDKPAFRKEHAQ